MFVLLFSVVALLVMFGTFAFLWRIVELLCKFFPKHKTIIESWAGGLLAAIWIVGGMGAFFVLIDTVKTLF